MPTDAISTGLFTELSWYSELVGLKAHLQNLFSSSQKTKLTVLVKDKKGKRRAGPFMERLHKLQEAMRRERERYVAPSRSLIVDAFFPEQTDDKARILTLGPLSRSPNFPIGSHPIKTAFDSVEEYLVTLGTALKMDNAYNNRDLRMLNKTSFSAKVVYVVQGNTNVVYGIFDRSAFRNLPLNTDDSFTIEFPSEGANANIPEFMAKDESSGGEQPQSETWTAHIMDFVNFASLSKLCCYLNRRGEADGGFSTYNLNGVVAIAHRNIDQLQEDLEKATPLGVVLELTFLPFRPSGRRMLRMTSGF